MSDRQATLKLSVEQLREQLKNPSLRDYLKKNLCVKEIYDNLWSAKVINNSIKSWIKSKEPAKEECNIKLLDHICECGDVRTFENLLEVLRKSSDDFPIHCEVVQKLEREFEVDKSKSCEELARKDASDLDGHGNDKTKGELVDGEPSVWSVTSDDPWPEDRTSGVKVKNDVTCSENISDNEEVVIESKELESEVPIQNTSASPDPTLISQESNPPKAHEIGLNLHRNLTQDQAEDGMHPEQAKLSGSSVVMFGNREQRLSFIPGQQEIKKAFSEPGFSNALDVEQLRTIVKEVHKNQPVDYNWKMLAAELQLPVPTIRIIQFNISTDEERHFETLKKWKQLKQSKATLNQLALVLKMFAFDVSEMLKINIGNEVTKGLTTVSYMKDQKITLSDIYKVAHELYKSDWGKFFKELHLENTFETTTSADSMSEQGFEIDFTKRFWALVDWMESRDPRQKDLHNFLTKIDKGGIFNNLFKTEYTRKNHDQQIDDNDGPDDSEAINGQDMVSLQKLQDVSKAVFQLKYQQQTGTCFFGVLEGKVYLVTCCSYLFKNEMPSEENNENEPEHLKSAVSNAEVIIPNKDSHNIALICDLNNGFLHHCGIIYIQCRNDKQKDPFYRPIKIHEGRAVSLGSILSVLQFHEQKMFLSYGPVEQLQVKKTEPRSYGIKLAMHSIDTKKSSSGAPVLLAIENDYYVVGVHKGREETKKTALLFNLDHVRLHYQRSVLH